MLCSVLFNSNYLQYSFGICNNNFRSVFTWGIEGNPFCDSENADGLWRENTKNLKDGWSYKIL